MASRICLILLAVWSAVMAMPTLYAIFAAWQAYDQQAGDAEAAYDAFRRVRP